MNIIIVIENNLKPLTKSIVILFFAAAILSILDNPQSSFAETATFTVDADFHVADNNAGGANSCDAYSTGSDTSSIIDMKVELSSPEDCRFAGFHFTGLTDIPSGSTIDSIVFKFDINNDYDSGNYGVDMIRVSTDTNTQTSAFFTECRSGTGTTVLSNSQAFQNAGNDKEVTFTDVSHMQTIVDAEEDDVTYCARFNDISATPHRRLDFTTSDGSPTPAPTLEVLYTTSSVPPAPTNLNATAQSSTQISLSWDAVTATPAVNGYKIERKIGTGNFTNLVSNTTSTSTTYDNTGLSPDTQYSYRVSAINSNGVGNPSNVASTQTPAESPPPTASGTTKNMVVETIPIDDITLGPNEIMIALDTTGTGSIEVISVTANLPCGASGPEPGSGNDSPDLKILAGILGASTIEVINATDDDIGFAGPLNTCIFRDLTNSTAQGIAIDSLFLTNDGASPISIPKGVMITLTGIFAEN